MKTGGTSIQKIFQAAHPGDLGIIGDPVSHSLSPAMHNPALKVWWKSRGGKTAATPKYHLFHVAPDQLEMAVEQVRTQNLRGVNVTVPHKENVVGLLNGLIGFAGRARAVNTIVNQGGQLLGYNTDADGFLDAVQEEFGISALHCHVLILGTGGTGAVLIRKLLDEGVGQIYYWNRTASKKIDEMDLSKRLQQLLSVQEINAVMNKVDLVINATSIGLNDKDHLPIEGLRFRKGQFVYDVVYHRKTTFLAEAEKAGAKATGGLGMLLHQGARAFEIWTGTKAPIDIMRKGLKTK